jgi:hypothetical protein
MVYVHMTFHDGSERSYVTRPPGPPDPPDDETAWTRRPPGPWTPIEGGTGRPATEEETPE